MRGLLRRLFGPAPPSLRDYRGGPKLAGLDPIAARGVELQKRYWTADPEQLAGLEARPFASLEPAELLRLHHLRCLALLDARDGILRRGLLAPIAERPTAAELELAVDPERLTAVESSAKALLGRRSPSRPRHGFVWLGSGPPEGDAVPYSDVQGRTLDASLTHLGTLEVIGLDDELEPDRVEFLEFDQILTISFAAAGPLGGNPAFRPARILREYGLDERVVLIPLRYGLSWFAHEPDVLRGIEEHQVAGIELGGLADPSKAIGNPLDRRSLAIAVGPRRLEVLSDYREDGDQGLSRFRLADAYQISLAIDQDDPQFTAKCRGRGLDPEATRGDVVRESRLRASAKATKQ